MNHKALGVTSRRVGIGLILVFLISLISCTGLEIEDTAKSNWPIKLLVYDDWDGPFNPNKFSLWKIKNIVPCPANKQHRHLFLISPLISDPQDVQIMVNILSEKEVRLLNYGYTFKGVRYVFTITDKKPGRYNQVIPKE